MDRDIRTEIVDYIRTNRMSTTEVSDALGKFGSLSGVVPLTSGHFVVGVVRAVTAVEGSNFFVHEAAEKLETGEVFLVSHDDKFGDVAILGDLVTKFAILYQNAEAVIVEGNVRDYSRLVREGYPVWSRGRNPVGAVNDKRGSRKSHPLDGGIAVCDDGGVVVIPPSHVTNDTLRSLRKVEATEDLWYFCLDTLGLSTFEIVCAKVYEDMPEAIPTQLMGDGN